MKILLLVFFFKIVYIFSKDISVSVTDEKLKLYGSNFSPMPLDNLREQLKDRSIDSNIFYLSKNIQREILFKRFSENHDILKPRAQASTEKKNPLTAEEEYLVENLSYYLGYSFKESSCITIMETICPYVSTYSGIDQKVRSVLIKKCEHKNQTCKEAVKKLGEYCAYLKSIYEKNKFSKSFCDKHIPKCKNLKKSCNNTLGTICETVERECKKKADEYVSDGRITNTHTVIVDTTVVEVKTIDYTHTEVSFAKTVCCGRIHYTTCKSSEPPKPTASLEPEEEEELKEEDDTEESSSSTGTEECVITLTSTVTNNIGETHTTTVTVTPGAKDKINNKDDGTRIGLQKAGLVYLIVGITAGIWTIV